MTTHDATHSKHLFALRLKRFNSSLKPTRDADMEELLREAEALSRKVTAQTEAFNNIALKPKIVAEDSSA